MSDTVFCMSYSAFGALLCSCNWHIVDDKVPNAPLGMYENVLSYEDMLIKRRYFVNPYKGAIEDDSPELAPLPYPEYRRFSFVRSDHEVVVIGSSYFNELFLGLKTDSFGMVVCNKDQVLAKSACDDDLAEDAALLCALSSEPAD